MKLIKVPLQMAVLSCGLFFAVHCAFGQTWTLTSAPINNWFSVASSADGIKLAVVAGMPTNAPGQIYTSADSGVTWTLTSAPTNNWSCIASSADGTKLAATAFNDRQIFVSTNSGATWIQCSAPSNHWRCIASSANGNTLAAGTFDALPIYISTNAGANWTLSGSSSTNWEAIAISADGTKLAAVALLLSNYSSVYKNIPFDGHIYVSTNSGAAWTLTTAPSTVWSCIASSADGTRFLAGSAPAPGNPPSAVYASTNSGVSWAQMPVPNFQSYISVASSADGKKLAAMDANGNIYISTNSGTTWNLSNNPYVSSLFWASIASSADGGKMVAVVANGKIYTLQSTLRPRLNLMPLTNQLFLAWTIPSTNFALQQSSDLTSWADVTNTPLLNLTNLQNEVILSPSNSSGFYRLKTP